MIFGWDSKSINCAKRLGKKKNALDVRNTLSVKIGYKWHYNCPGLRTITRVPYRIQKDHGRNMLLFNELWTQLTQRKNPVKYGHQGDTPWCMYYCSAKKALRTNVVLILLEKQTKRKKGRINLKGEGTITPAKSQGSETCVVGGRKPQTERKAETMLTQNFGGATKSIMVFLKKAY